MSYVNPLHSPVAPGRTSEFSSLGSAIGGPWSTRYRLNQAPYVMTSKFHAAMGRKKFEDIQFSWARTTGCQMQDLKARSVSGILAEMRGGSDRPFAHARDLTKITLHILWPGYSHLSWDRTIDVIEADGTSITRARLAQLISEIFINFTERARITQSTQVKDHIGPQGIRPEHLYLISLQNVIENHFQATVDIDMR